MRRPIHITVIATLYGLTGLVLSGFAASILFTRGNLFALLGIALGVLAVIAATAMLRERYYGAIVAGGLIAFDASHDASKLVYRSATGLPDRAESLPVSSIAAIYLSWFVVLFLVFRSLFSNKALAWFDRPDRSPWLEMGKAFITGGALFCVFMVVTSLS